MGRLVALVIAITAALYEIAVQSLGLAWFWGGFSPCERVVALFPLIAVVAGIGAATLPKRKSMMVILATATALMAFGIIAAGLAMTRSDVPCGRPVQIDYSWIFFVVVAVLGVLTASRFVPKDRDKQGDIQAP